LISWQKYHLHVSGSASVAGASAQACRSRKSVQRRCACSKTADFFRMRNCLWNFEGFHKTRRQASHDRFVQSTRENECLHPSEAIGSLQAALKKARLPVPKLGRRYSEDEYFENLLAVWTRYARQPTYGEMSDSTVADFRQCLREEMGYLEEGLLAFLERVNSDTSSERPESPATTCHGNATNSGHTSRCPFTAYARRRST